MEEPVETHESSGNVFADLGLPDPDLCLVKAEAVLQIKRAMRAQGLTQTAAAARMGLTQPQVSNLLRGRTSNFSLDRLFRCVNALGRNVQIGFAPAAAEKGEVRLHLLQDAPAEGIEAEEPQRKAA